MTDKIQQTRRAAFEDYVMREHGNPALNKDGDYFCDITHGAWLGFNAALDCVLIEFALPTHNAWHDYDQGYNSALSDCRSAIESTNLGIKIK